MSLFLAFASATALIQPSFKAELEQLLPVQLLVSDGFLWWTLESASKFGIPRMVFYGMSNYAFVMYTALSEMKPPLEEAADGAFTVMAFPWIKVTRNDLELLPNPQSAAVHLELMMKTTESTINGYGLLVNSFEELEPVSLNYWNCEAQPRAWCVGPLCLVDQPEPDANLDKPAWARWLDQKQEEGRLFTWRLDRRQRSRPSSSRRLQLGSKNRRPIFSGSSRRRSGSSEMGSRKGRGLVVRDWVDQRSILMQPCLQGFLSHCGWNPVLESICGRVPILARPMMAKQPLNAKMVEEELRIGLRVDGQPFKGEGGLVR